MKGETLGRRKSYSRREGVLVGGGGSPEGRHEGRRESQRDGGRGSWGREFCWEAVSPGWREGGREGVLDGVRESWGGRIPGGSEGICDVQKEGGRQVGRQANGQGGPVISFIPIESILHKISQNVAVWHCFPFHTLSELFACFTHNFTLDSFFPQSISGFFRLIRPKNSPLR